MSTKFLNSWKEIAGYLGRTVRTVQRWERNGLPVRRPLPHRRSAVMAIPEEIDRWIQTRPQDRAQTCPLAPYCEIASRLRGTQLRAKAGRRPPEATPAPAASLLE
jgi:hypothetical protein